MRAGTPGRAVKNGEFGVCMIRSFRSLHCTISLASTAQLRTETMHVSFSIFYLDQNGATQ